MSVTSTGDQVTDALDGKTTFEQGKNRIIVKDENNIPRIILGYLPDGTIGLVISKEGVDVLTVF